MSVKPITQKDVTHSRDASLCKVPRIEDCSEICHSSGVSCLCLTSLSLSLSLSLHSCSSAGVVAGDERLGGGDQLRTSLELLSCWKTSTRCPLDTQRIVSHHTGNTTEPLSIIYAPFDILF